MCGGSGAVTFRMDPAGWGISSSRACRCSRWAAAPPGICAAAPPYLPSPRIGVPIAAQCARSWWVRPVSGQQGEPARPVAGSVDHPVIGDGVLAVIVGADPLAAALQPLGHGSLGEREVDPALPHLRQPGDDRPIGLPRRLVAKGAGEERGRRRGARDQQQPAGVLVEPVNQARPLVRNRTAARRAARRHGGSCRCRLARPGPAAC